MNSNIFSMSNLTRYSELISKLIETIIGLIASLIFVGLDIETIT